MQGGSGQGGGGMGTHCILPPEPIHLHDSDLCQRYHWHRAKLTHTGAGPYPGPRGQMLPYPKTSNSQNSPAV